MDGQLALAVVVGHIDLTAQCLSLIHISEPTRQEAIAYFIFFLGMVYLYLSLIHI